MDIREISNTINRRAFISKSEFYKLQALRADYYGGRTQSLEPFAGKGIKDDEDYAFHLGGRQEIQFNIGTDSFKGYTIFRYGLAFSLNTGQTLHDPKATFRPLIRKFNKFYSENKTYFKDICMWYYRNGSFVKFFTKVQEIDADMFQTNNFIFLGRYFEKDINKINHNDIDVIVDFFSYLMELYKVVQLGKQGIENRISKLCWNDNDWVSPTGEQGKSKDPESFEALHGYGHEEWLFDFEKIIDGNHYCMLQTVARGRDSYIPRTFNVELYSHNSTSKSNWWVGSIKEMNVISGNQSKRIHDKYVKKGWKDEMAKQIKEIDGDYRYFLNLKPEDFFNISFKPENTTLYKPQRALVNFDNNIGTYHYIFKKADKDIEKFSNKNRIRQFNFKASKFDKSTSTRKSFRKEKVIQIRPLHDEIQESLYNYLLSQYNSNCISCETDTGINTRIDITVSTGGKLILYEVKTYPSIMISIRMALGQLLEYAFWPEPITTIHELIIVSHLEPDEVDKRYIKFLRKKTQINVSYQQYDLKTNMLMNKI